MKIIPKLTLAFVGCTCALLTLNGVLRVQRERGLFEEDRVRDHEMIARSLAAATDAVWRADGPKAALDAIDAVQHPFHTLQIRWVPAEATGTLDVPAARLASTPSGQPITHVARGLRGGQDVWYTLVPLDVSGVRRGVLELTEPRTSERTFVRNVAIETVALTLALALAAAALSFLLGQWLVGARVGALTEKARRVGRGDFSGPLAFGHHDELTDLGREINAMCDRLSTTIDQLRHADRLATVGKLASGVAHELGTPLNVVSARAKMILDADTGPDASREYAGVIVAATDRMTKTIRHLLRFARRGQVDKAPHALGALVRETLDLLRPLADKRGVHLELAPAGADAVANVDGAQVQQVLTNLAMNAIQAMPSGGAVDVRVHCERARTPEALGGVELDCVCVTVRDTGEGIAPEHLPHVFEPFFTTKDVGEGTGLGLAVAYGIVEEHGGWIDVRSQLGRGTTFDVYLPAGEAP